MTHDWISEVIRDISELDHASPEGFPEQMIVTAEELRVILERQGAERDALRKALVEFVHYADDCDDDSPELDRARAALAKEPK